MSRDRLEKDCNKVNVMAFRIDLLYIQKTNLLVSQDHVYVNLLKYDNM
jgi:hypothetical protein